MKVDQPLHLKYRPKTFDEIIGNEKVVESLRSIINRTEGRPHSFLLSGPAGCGKTSLARIIKNELGCSDRDFKELNMSDTRSINDMRDIIGNSKFAPVVGPCKIYLLDECHRLLVDAQNSILKILEDTPAHVYFILCTTEPEKLLKTIRSRCTKYQVVSQNSHGMTKLLKWVVEEEEANWITDKVIAEIIKAAEGSPRNALVILDSIIDLDKEETMIQTIVDFSVKQESVVSLCRALLDAKPWKTISEILSNIEDEPEKVRYAVLGWMNSVLLKAENTRAAEIIGNFLESFMYSGKAGLTLACFLSTPASKNKK